MSYRNIRAAMIETLRQYCFENDLRPYLWVSVDDACIVPTDYVQDNMIVFDVDEEAVREFELTDEYVSFAACFDDNEPMHVVVPLNRIAHTGAAEEPMQGPSFIVSDTPSELRARILGKTPQTSAQAPASEEPAPRRPMRIK